MDNNTLYTILQRYFKALSYTGYVQLQDLQYLIVLVYINDIQEYIDQSIIDKALEIIKSKCIFYNNSFDIEDQEYCPIKDNTYSIDFFNINLSSDKVKLNIGQGSNIKSVTIPSATQSLAGVLSSNDKVVIGKINEAINQNILIGGLSTQQSANTISIGYSQMNPDSSFEDKHINLPLATQSKAGLLSKEDKYIIDNVRSDIAEAEITSFTKTATPNNITLTLQSANSRFSVQLNRANLGEAGLVLGTDIDTINKANNLLTSYRPLVDEINVTPTENTIELGYLYYDGNDQSVYSYDVELPAATTTTAGIMTASDKSIVNNANTLLSNSPLVDKLQFAVADNKRWLQYKNNGNSLFTGISMPIFGEKIQVIADYESTGSTNCSINLLALDDSVISSTNIPIVNERHDGVMSASIYTDWLQVKGLADQLWNTTINTFDVGYNLDSVNVSLLTNGGDPIGANIEAATITKAGVMSAEDKQQLDMAVNSLPKVTDTFEGAAQDTGLRYVIRKNKLIAILKDGRVQYAPEGLAYVDAIAPTSFVYGTKTYDVPAGVSYVELGQPALTSVGAILRDNAGIRAFGLYADTSKNTSLRLVFSIAADLEWLDVSAMDTSAVTYGESIFYGSAKLREIVGKLDLSKATSINSCFDSCTALERVDIPTITAACTAMSRTFCQCASLTSLDVSSWDLSKVTAMNELCRGCKSLKTIVLPTASNPVLTNINHFFNETGLESVDLNDFDVSAVTQMIGAFRSNPNLLEVIIPNWHAPNLTEPQELFAFDDHLERVDISGLTMDKVTNVMYMFLRNYALTSLKFPNMGQLKADTDKNKTIALSDSPLDRASLDSIFTYDRTANGLTNPLTVKLSKTSKALLSAEDIAAITAKGYTIV